ncbi:hypothetical protein TSUD_101450 [Trifolium subterraneum]|uniref:Uncharacterized protein n=1 Tax=Trifolium subterraneum TaxID=3900 RepID=A0A2Z6MJC3_TRISU|nr:hypothetical protein TSUD_101450 [Trifolium subterraneum]
MHWLREGLYLNRRKICLTRKKLYNGVLTAILHLNMIDEVVKVIENDYTSALKVYDEMTNEKPSDFRPYLCRGFVFTLLRKNDEAEKQFDEYRKLVPENHPHKKYFEDNAKIFLKKLDKGGIEATI